jgi:stress response protein SCP2
MAASLSRGGNVALSKVAPGVERVVVGLGWSTRSGGGEEIDLDSSAFLIGHHGKVRSDYDFIFYNNPQSSCGSVVHSGDKQAGNGDWDNETVTIDLKQVPENVARIKFCVTIYDAESQGQNFGMVDSAFIRIVNAANNQEILRYSLTRDADEETAMVFGELYRHYGDWKFRAIGQGYTGGLGSLATSFGVALEEEEEGGNEAFLAFFNALHEVAARIPTAQVGNTMNEQATKNALIMPFIEALGYDTRDPAEVAPEFDADVWSRKSERVDYALLKDGVPQVLVECKSIQTPLLTEHAGQLSRYFNATPDTRFAILTNGTDYQCYTDLDRPNVMDREPFFRFDLRSFKEQDARDLFRFTRPVFTPDEILAWAKAKLDNEVRELQYYQETYKAISREMQSPSDEFVRFFISKVFHGTITSEVIQQFAPIMTQAIQQVFEDQIRALRDEIEGHAIIKCILRDKVDTERIEMRSVQSYCGILLDHNNRRPICRLYLKNPRQMVLELFDQGKDRGEKISIETLDDIYHHAERLKATVDLYR